MLKSVEIQGFKSFADKTLFDFPEGITAVVGPNGSGKSNVVDAIRWVLGEQSSKNIRINNSAEVIFSGTPSRPGSAFAQIAIRFDNERNIFPIEYSEVSIARKIYRDGNSEYFINKKQVRLKDVVQLLASAKLGVKGMNIINQGAADIFLRANPVERREMIEEMVGLKELRIKKEEAGRKIRETKDNLLQVKTLIAEMEPNLHSLKRQVSRWQSRAAKETELKALEESFFVAKLFELDAISVPGLSESGGKNTEALRREQQDLEVSINSLGLLVKTLDIGGPENNPEHQALIASAQLLREKKTEIVRRLGNIEGQIEALERSGRGKETIDVGNIRPKIEAVITRLETAETQNEISVVKEAIKEVVVALRQVFSGNQPDKALGDAVRELTGIRNRDLTELESITKLLRDAEKNIQQLQTGASQKSEKLRLAYQELEDKRVRLREVEGKMEEVRFAEEKRKIKEEDLRARVEEAAWDYEILKGIYASRKDSSGVSLADFQLRETEIKIIRLRRDLGAIGEIDSSILTECEEINNRYTFLTGQEKDLSAALQDWETLDVSLEEKISSGFDAALAKIDKEFNRYFGLIFEGGAASLRVAKPKTEPVASESAEEGAVSSAEELGEQESGIEFSVRLPRKKIRSLEMLSGGEKALTAIALLFAIVAYAHPPFLVFDEIDAALDEHNSGKIGFLLKDLSKHVQFVLITHNRAVMEAAQVLYGVTMDDGVSRVFSLRFAEAQEIAKKDIHPM